MRYIRTEDGRIIDTTKIVTGSKYMDFATNDESFRAIFNTKPLAKSDILYELCDEFRYEFNEFKVLYSNHERCWRNNKIGKWYDYDTDIVLSEKEISTIKGGIWTDKGFIYVAKMDENGDFELIAD